MSHDLLQVVPDYQSLHDRVQGVLDELTVLHTCALHGPLGHGSDPYGPESAVRGLVTPLSEAKRQLEQASGLLGRLTEAE